MILDFLETEWFDLFVSLVFCAGVNVIACCTFVPILGLLSRLTEETADVNGPLLEKILRKFFYVCLIDLLLAVFLLFNSEYGEKSLLETLASNIFGSTIIVWIFGIGFICLTFLIGLLRAISMPELNWLFSDEQVNDTVVTQKERSFNFILSDLDESPKIKSPNFPDRETAR